MNGDALAVDLNLADMTMKEDIGSDTGKRVWDIDERIAQGTICGRGAASRVLTSLDG